MVSKIEMVTSPMIEHVERAQGAADKYLVNDDLKKQRRNERKQLQKKRSRQNLAKQMAIFVDGSEKPADVEASREIYQSGAACHQE